MSYFQRGLSPQAGCQFCFYCRCVTGKMTESLDSGTANTMSSLDENTTNSLSIMDVSVFVEYLKKTVSTILHGDKSATSPMLDMAFDDTANLECVKKFLSDPNTATIFVQKSVLKGMVFNGICLLLISVFRYSQSQYLMIQLIEN